jgi:NADH:ubiquinone oxidoreductase subunit 6 (subunit J)
MSKILRIVLIVLMALSVFICFLFYIGGEDVNGQPVFTNLYIVWAYALTGVAVGFTVIFPIIQMITNPKNTKKSLIGVLVLGAIVLVSYLVSSGELLGIIDPELIEYDTPSTLKYAGTMLYTNYLLAGLAIVAMAYSEISKALK